MYSILLSANGSAMLFMVIERFRHRSAPAIYRRLRERGRMLPEGLRYVNSWTETNFERCFQLIECDDPSLFGTWTARWSDLVDFEITPVWTSEEASRRSSRATDPR